jgi:hypothetical protein
MMRQKDIAEAAQRRSRVRTLSNWCIPIPTNLTAGPSSVMASSVRRWKPLSLRPPKGHRRSIEDQDRLHLLKILDERSGKDALSTPTISFFRSKPKRHCGCTCACKDHCQRRPAGGRICGDGAEYSKTPAQRKRGAIWGGLGKTGWCRILRKRRLLQSQGR